MIYKLLADLVFIAHLTFVLFVVLGGIAVWKVPKLAWLHFPPVAWGALIEFAGWNRPLLAERGRPQKERPRSQERGFLGGARRLAPARPRGRCLSGCSLEEYSNAKREFIGGYVVDPESIGERILPGAGIAERDIPVLTIEGNAVG